MNMDWSGITKRREDLAGWLDDARHGRLQSIAVGCYVQRDLWRFAIDRHKGWLMISVGPVFVEFGG